MMLEIERRAQYKFRRNERKASQFSFTYKSKQRKKKVAEVATTAA